MSIYRLNASYSITPSTGGPSGEAVISAPIFESIGLKRKHVDEITLIADGAVAVSFGGLASASVVTVYAKGGYVRARITHADGAVQSVPVDPLLVIISLLKPITALDLMREPGKDTPVEIFLGEKL